MSPPPETRLAFWSLAYLVALHRGDEDARDIADEALTDFDIKTNQLNKEHASCDTSSQP